ncbi:hypothetical protein MRX96_003700 [Rhipicephalus microplus]
MHEGSGAYGALAGSGGAERGEKRSDQLSPRGQVVWGWALSRFETAGRRYSSQPQWGAPQAPGGCLVSVCIGSDCDPITGGKCVKNCRNAADLPRLLLP